jgi:hypothetical protein
VATQRDNLQRRSVQNKELIIYIYEARKVRPLAAPRVTSRGVNSVEGEGNRPMMRCSKWRGCEGVHLAALRGGALDGRTVPLTAVFTPIQGCHHVTLVDFSRVRVGDHNCAPPHLCASTHEGATSLASESTSASTTGCRAGVRVGVSEITMITDHSRARL